jgi:hypothetical protein
MRSRKPIQPTVVDRHRDASRSPTARPQPTYPFHDPARRPLRPDDVLRAQSLFGNRAVQRLLSRAITKPSTAAFSQQRSDLKALEKAVRGKDQASADSKANSLYGSDAQYFGKLLKYKLNKHGTNDAKRGSYLSLAPAMSVLRDALAAQDSVLVGQLRTLIPFLSKAELATVAKNSPDFFLDAVLKPMHKNADKFRELLLDNYFDPSQKQLGGVTGQATESEDMRTVLRAKLGTKWVDFAKSVPVLALAEEAAEHFAQAGEAPAPADIIDRIFDSYIGNRGINIGYYASSKDRTEKLMMGGPKEDAIQADLGDAPPRLRTQCDDIMKILREAVRAYPGLKVTFTIGMEKQALLTKPLDSLPGGLIPRDALGNVQDAKGNWTKQIFFTGVQDSKNPNSHTWLIINGKPYDAVLGTKGAGVARSNRSRRRIRTAKTRGKRCGKMTPVTL